MAAKRTERAQIIGRLVRQATIEAGLKNSSLALATGIPRRTIVRIANGHNAAGLATLEKIAAATGKPLDFFRPEVVQPASERVRVAAEDLVEALVDELRDRLEAQAEARQAAAL